MVSAHTDEIGLVVRDIDPSGMIRFDKLGWFSDSFLPGTRVRVGKIPGMVGIKSGHLMTEEEKRTVLPHRSLYIDVGAKSAAEVEKMGISIGDPIAFDVPFGRWHDPDYCCGKAIDNRAACAVAVALMESLTDDDFPGTLWVVGPSRKKGAWEERGPRPSSSAPTGSSPWMWPWQVIPRKIRRAANRSGWGTGQWSNWGISWNPPKGDILFIPVSRRQPLRSAGKRAFPFS